ncbi:MAG: winged helix-turn-helix domain-containing protein [Candidatus Thorarchaeota archaeon]
MTFENDHQRDLEDEVFKTLSHQIRRDILRFIGERGGAKFTEIKIAARIEESASLSYHLNALSPLLIHETDSYRLSELGRDSYTLMNKIVTYSASAAILGAISKKLGATIIANALLWASAIFYMSVVEGPLQTLTLGVFASLFSVSNLILYSITQDTKLG